MGERGWVWSVVDGYKELVARAISLIWVLVGPHFSLEVASFTSFSISGNCKTVFLLCEVGEWVSVYYELTNSYVFLYALFSTCVIVVCLGRKGLLYYCYWSASEGDGGEWMGVEMERVFLGCSYETPWDSMRRTRFFFVCLCFVHVLRTKKKILYRSTILTETTNTERGQ